mgnify:CR=1 FL=1
MEHDTYTEWRDRKDGKFVWSDMIKRDLDACVLQADDFGEFLKLLMNKGYEVKQNKYLAVKPPGMGRYRRCKYFGTDYTEERLRERILIEDMEYYREHHGGAKIINSELFKFCKRITLDTDFGFQLFIFFMLIHKKAVSVLKFL